MSSVNQSTPLSLSLARSLAPALALESLCEQRFYPLSFVRNKTPEKAVVPKFGTF